MKDILIQYLKIFGMLFIGNGFFFFILKDNNLAYLTLLSICQALVIMFLIKLPPKYDKQN